MISIDFIIELLESPKFNIVMTVVDLVSKTAHFILIYTMISTERVARLFIHMLYLTIVSQTLFSLYFHNW